MSFPSFISLKLFFLYKNALSQNRPLPPGGGVSLKEEGLGESGYISAAVYISKGWIADKVVLHNSWA
jgi:hypothetical protein